VEEASVAMRIFAETAAVCVAAVVGWRVRRRDGKRRGRTDQGMAHAQKVSEVIMVHNSRAGVPAMVLEREEGW
jgi:hypothetical protein